MTEEPQHFDLRSHDLVADRRDELLRLFPEARTEDGQIDFNHLRLALGDTVLVGRERYGMTWPGKADCFKAIHSPSLATLLPVPDESVNFSTADNLIIEGDNLEVLKLLQKSYIGKIKMIYIDPPYNTGSDFIYSDDYTDPMHRYLEYSGQVDGQGKKYATNTESDGRFHSRWLSMMYPRLYIARHLLREDGVILVSMNDGSPPASPGELRGLRAILDEIFGEENFLATLIWNKQHSQQQGLFKRYHEYVVCYAKSAVLVGGIGGGEGEIDAGALKKISNANPASEFTFPAGVRFEAQDGVVFTGTFGVSEKVTVVRGRLVARDGKTAEEVTLSAGWTQKAQMTRYFRGETVFDTRGQRVLEFYFNSAGKLKSRKNRSRITPPTILPTYGMVSEQTSHVSKLFGNPVFDAPKPVNMMADFLKWFVEKDDIVLDFFAGSGSLCEAVICSTESARFIAVQLPEPVDLATDAGRNAQSHGLATVSDITKERTRLVINQLHPANGVNENPGSNGAEHYGFRVFKLAESNFTPWDPESATDPDLLQLALLDHVDHIRERRTGLDLLYEILLKSGYELTVSFEVETIEGRSVYNVDGGALFVFLDGQPTLELVRSMAERRPQRVVMLDAGFRGDDQLKANAAQTFKYAGASEGEQVVFRTI